MVRSNKADSSEYFESTDGVDKDKEVMNARNESMLRTFKISSMGIVSEVKKRQFYLKPSVKRKSKTENAQRRRSKFNKQW